MAKDEITTWLEDAYVDRVDLPRRVIIHLNMY